MRHPSTRSPRLSLRAAVLAAAACLTVPLVHADTLLVLESRRDGFVLQGRAEPEQQLRVELWIGDGRIRRDDGRTAAILAGERLVLVNHETETYSVLDLPVDVMSMLPPELRRAAETWRIEVEVTPREETRKVGEWLGRGYDVRMSNAVGLSLSSRLWLTGDLDVDLAAFRKLSVALGSLQPGGGDALRALYDLEGFPILLETEADLDGTQVRSEERLIEATHRDPPAGLYEPPAGYARREFRPGDGPGL